MRKIIVVVLTVVAVATMTSIWLVSMEPSSGTAIQGWQAGGGSLLPVKETPLW